MKLYLASDFGKWAARSRRSYYLMCGRHGIGRLYDQSTNRYKWQLFRLHDLVDKRDGAYTVLRSNKTLLTELRPSPPQSAPDMTGRVRISG